MNENDEVCSYHTVFTLEYKTAQIISIKTGRWISIHEARDICKDIGGDLLTDAHEAVKYQKNEEDPDEFWFGVYYSAKDSKYKGIDGSDSPLTKDSSIIKFLRLKSSEDKDKDHCLRMKTTYKLTADYCKYGWMGKYGNAVCRIESKFYARIQNHSIIFLNRVDLIKDILL